MSTKRRPVFIRHVSAAFFLLSLCSTSAFSVELSGRASLWSYLRNDSVDHVQLVPMLAFTLHQLGHESLSLQTTLRGFTDFQNGESTGESVRLHRAVLLYKPRGKRYELRVGQQWVTEGVGRGNVLGLWGRYDATEKIDLVAFAGSRLPNAISTDESVPNEGFSAGLNARMKIKKSHVGVSYFHVEKSGDLLYNGAGLDASSRVSPDLILRARLHMNIERSKLETGELAAQWQASDKVQVSAKAQNAAPRVFEDSFFATMIENTSTSSLRGSVRWTFWSDFYTSCGGTTVFSEGDQLYKVRAGVGIPELELGYTHWLAADKGDMDGFYGQALCSLVDDLDMLAGFDYARGSNSEIRPNTESQSAWLGASWSPISTFSVSARGEHLRDIQRKDDWRALISVSSIFSTF